MEASIPDNIIGNIPEKPEGVKKEAAKLMNFATLPSLPRVCTRETARTNQSPEVLDTARNWVAVEFLRHVLGG